MKKQTYILIAGIVLIAVFSFFYFRKNSPITNYPSAGTDIIAFGDSLVQGVGASATSTNFVSLLSAKIGAPIINLGVSGNTTKDGIARLNELDQFKPKVIILLLGGNDRLRQLPKTSTFQNLETIIQNFQSRGAVVLLLGVRGGLIGDSYEAEFKNLSRKFHTAYTPDVLDGLFGNKKYMSDAVHPNDLGYQKIADKIFPELKKIIK